MIKNISIIIISISLTMPVLYSPPAEAGCHSWDVACRAARAARQNAQAAWARAQAAAHAAAQHAAAIAAANVRHQAEVAAANAAATAAHAAAVAKNAAEAKAHAEAQRIMATKTAALVAANARHVAEIAEAHSRKVKQESDAAKATSEAIIADTKAGIIKAGKFLIGSGTCKTLAKELYIQAEGTACGYAAAAVVTELCAATTPWLGLASQARCATMVQVVGLAGHAAGLQCLGVTGLGKLTAGNVDALVEETCNIKVR